MASGTNDPIDSVGVVQHPHIPEAAPLAEEVAQTLRQMGVEVWITQDLDQPHVARQVAETDLLVTLGGDGSILRAARAADEHATLILGINLGRMGFLTEAEPEEWREVLPQVLRGEYWIEERMMLHAVVREHGEIATEGEALNDVVVGQGSLGRVVRLEVRVDGDLLTTYVTDALIVATPTGSTAYALAAGGPIMPPEQRNILLVPVAPHLSLDRPVVLAEGVQVEVIVRGHSPAALTLDGQTVAKLETGDLVHVGASSHTAHFARIRARDYFYRTLMRRLVPREPDDYTRSQ